MNKMDLVPAKNADAIELQIREINGSAILKRTTRSQVPIDFIFDLHSFDDKTRDPFSVDSEVVTRKSHIDKVSSTISQDWQS